MLVGDLRAAASGWRRCFDLDDELHAVDVDAPRRSRRRRGAGCAPPFSSSRRLASRSAATSATWCGCVRSTFAASPRTRSLSRSHSIATGPVIASMRRTLAALEVSVVMLEGADLGGRAHVRAAAQLARPRPSPTSTIRTTSPYFSPNSAIAPRLRASSSVVVSARTRLVGEDPLVDAVLDRAHVLLAQRRAVGEVEAQLVGPDVGAGLAHVRAEALAQRGVQQVRRGVVALGGAARGAVDERDHALALVQLALRRARAPAPGRRRSAARR